ncbi:MAG: hypothetical protein A3I00_09300 [Betaproteobacteria bacterium RIFCSPLOWO2_02_FULL_64_12]|nr:MAG: hypothetical protein A3I00_09300 [Betaproteobacteria bacterium RIFCSPLOWO2_02_FULL_64_12]
MRFVALIVALLPAVVWAQPSRPWYLTDEFEDKPWEEQKAQMPPYPKSENLVRITVSAVTSFEFFVDTASVSVGKDGAVRYTLVARSPSGAMNVSFEGIRCDTRERKLYAFGSTGNSWIQARNADWVRIREVTANRQHAALADDYFCPGRIPVRTTEEALDAVKRGGHPASR